jgi:hypothetical protein
MQRRTFISGLLLLGGGVVGHYLTKRTYGSTGPTLDPKAFALALQGVTLQYASQELLLKIFSRQISDSDRQLLVAEVVDHNRNLFVKQAYERQHGTPGFYRIIE